MNRWSHRLAVGGSHATVEVRKHGVNGRRRALRDFDPETMREATFQEYLRLLAERGYAAVVKHVSSLVPAPAP